MPAQPRFHEGHLKVSPRRSLDSAIVRTGTPVLDVALMMEQTDAQYVIVQNECGAIVGVVSQADLNHFTEMASEDSTSTWRSRPIESLMPTRLALPPAPPHPNREGEQASGKDISCTPILEQGRIVGVMTDDDVLVSWSRLEPALRAAGTDDVTKLANRTMFMRRLSEEWDRSSRSHEPIALLLFDVDCFKQVNDQCGHMAGDEVLTAVGNSLRESLRSYDVVARIGGDEFAALCFNCRADYIDQPIERIQESIQRIEVPAGLTRSNLTLSIGAAVVRSDKGRLTTDELLSSADACLYRAKEAGRNRAFRIVLDDASLEPEYIGLPRYAEGSVDYLLHPESCTAPESSHQPAGSFRRAGSLEEIA